jgi:hypothetical protein
MGKCGHHRQRAIIELNDPLANHSTVEMIA